MEKVETTVHECQTDIEVRESGKKSQLTSLFGFIFGLLDNLLGRERCFLFIYFSRNEISKDYHLAFKSFSLRKISFVYS